MKTIAEKVLPVNALMSNQKWTAELDGDILFAGTDARRQPVTTIDQETVAQLMVELSEPTSEELFLATALTLLRNGTISPSRLTDEQLNELEDERIGAELCETPHLW